MKKVILIIIAIWSINQVTGQAWLDNLPKNTTEYNFYDYQSAFNSYWDSYNVENGYYYNEGVKTKARGWKQCKRLETI